MLRNLFTCLYCNYNCTTVRHSGFLCNKVLKLVIRKNSSFQESSGNIINSLRHYLEQLVIKHEMLSKTLGDQKLSSDEYRKVSCDISDLEEVVTLFQQLKNIEQDLNDSTVLLSNPELKELALQEIKDYEKQIDKIKTEILNDLIENERDEDDMNSAILELRSGAGGLEASLFTADMFQMYQKYASYCGWQFESLEINETELGGYKNASVSVTGQGVYGTLKYESGVHRVQRIPATVSKDKMHTSTTTIAILPQPSEVDVKINDSDIRIDTFRASGAGGQHVNTTDSAVRLTHLPTGIVISIQDERSQHKNKSKAMQILKARIYNIEKERLNQERGKQRKEQIGTGERHERIRTYNYLQDRVTDHRLGLTVQGAKSFLSGGSLLHDMIQQLKVQSNTLNLLKLAQEEQTK